MLMDVLFLLVPLSVLLALAVMGVLAWAVWSGQFEELETEGQRIFLEDEVEVEAADAAQKPSSSEKTSAPA
jgi:cbb3-type cytochrome oxidase maturation protein